MGDEEDPTRTGTEHKVIPDDADPSVPLSVNIDQQEARLDVPFFVHTDEAIPADMNKGEEGIDKTSKDPEATPLSPSQQIFVNPKVLNRSLFVLKLGVLADAVNTTILQPNYPIMATPGAHPDSFEDTGPFGFSAATYFIPMTALTGIAIASVVIGSLSDKYGRRPCFLACLYISVIFSILKYFLRGNFWTFCAVNFLNGLFSATTPIGMAYAGDIYTNKKEKTMAIGMVGACNMLGTSGGGVVSILMEEQGLFAPLWFGISLMVLAAILNTKYLIEPDRSLASVEYKTIKGDETDTEMADTKVVEDWDESEEDEEDQVAPETINIGVLCNIITGAFADNVGTAGLNPFCLSPLAYTAYYLNFESEGLSPVMSLSGYKWLSTLLALMIIPAVFITPEVFSRVGAAGGCVVGNIVTAIITGALLYTALEAPATSGWFAAFIVILYCGFPFTVFSQLSTGPMLDSISPVHKRGFTQGLNTAVMNFGQALTPWALGLLSDATEIKTSIWFCIGVSCLAALVNSPLLFRDGLGPPKAKKPAEERALKGEDKDLVEQALRGEYIPVRVLDALNHQRIQKGQPLLVVHYGKYADEKGKLSKLRQNAKSDFHHLIQRKELYLGDLTSEENRIAICKTHADTMSRYNPDVTKEVDQELGQWFTDYLKDSGYTDIYSSGAATKQMIMTAFPLITQEKEWTPDTVQDTIINTSRVYRKFIELDDQVPYAEKVKKLLATTQSARKVY